MVNHWFLSRLYQWTELSKHRPISRKQALSEYIPKTAGKLLLETELRSYVKCSEFYRRGGEIEESFGLRVVRNATEKAINLFLKGKIKEPLTDIQSCLLKAITECNADENLLSPQLTKYMHSCLLWLREFFELFPLKNYEPVLGKIQPIVKIAKTPIKLEFSGIFRSKKYRTVHGVTFSPFGSEHSMMNDPSIPLKLKVLESICCRRGSREKAVLHVFAIGKNDNLNYHSISSDKLNPRSIRSLESIIMGMEREVYFPVIPCHHSCPFKTTCLPDAKGN